MKKPIFDQWQRYEIRMKMPDGNKNRELLNLWKAWRDFKRTIYKFKTETVISVMHC